jgi:16S rRNA (uracil1498-N3)-methyltransferase
MYRFFVEEEFSGSGEVVLTGPEAHHALHVVRVQQGEPVALFDGHGREIVGTVARASRREVTVAVEEIRETPRPTVSLSICQAWLHREKSLEYLVERGTELGVSEFVFYRGDHSEGAPRVSGKLRRAAVEACKQCGRLWLPDFRTSADLDACIEEARGAKLAATHDLPAHPLRSASFGNEAAIFVGPEGDFSARELQLLSDARVVALSLGPATFRSEVAATLAAALALYEMGGLGPIVGNGCVLFKG